MHVMDLIDHNGDADDLRFHFRSRVFRFGIYEFIGGNGHNQLDWRIIGTRWMISWLIQVTLHKFVQGFRPIGFDRFEKKERQRRN